MHALLQLMCLSTIGLVAAIAHADNIVELDFDREVSLQASGAPMAPSLIVVDDVVYFWSGHLGRAERPQLPRGQVVTSTFDEGSDALRMFNGNVTEDWDKKDSQRYGWYLTADYSTNPPQVVVTQSRTKYSRWTFVPVSQQPQQEIRNRGTRTAVRVGGTSKTKRSRQGSMVGDRELAPRGHGSQQGGQPSLGT